MNRDKSLIKLGNPGFRGKSGILRKITKQSPNSRLALVSLDTVIKDSIYSIYP